MSLRQSIAVHASQLRESMAIGDNEVIGDIVSLIQEAGYHYMDDSFGDDFSGFSQALGGGDYLIGFNRNHFWSDKFHRFTISHELGHITIPRHRQILEAKGLHRSKSEFQAKDQIEREADYFAICFLAPSKAFQMEIEVQGVYEGDHIRFIRALRNFAVCCCAAFYGTHRPCLYTGGLH